MINGRGVYLDIDPLSVALVAIDSRGDHDESVCTDVVTYATWSQVSLWLRGELESEGLGQGQGEEEGDEWRGTHRDGGGGPEETVLVKNGEEISDVFEWSGGFPTGLAEWPIIAIQARL